MLLKNLKLKLADKKYLYLGLFIVFFFASRLPGLASDVINPDGVNWHERSEQFIVGLKTKNFEKTYQHYHPGVTLMWLSGSAVEVLRQLSPADRVYTSINFLTFHFVAKFALVVAQLILSIILIYALTHIFDFGLAYFMVVLLSLEPFFLGNSRLLHLDVLLSLFLLIGLTFAYVSLKKFTFLTSVAAGVFLGLAFLTKSIAIGGLLFVVVMAKWHFIRTKNFKELTRYILVIAVSFAAVVFVFFPALWVKPLYYLVEIFSEGERVGVRKGHSQLFLGEETRNPGLFFYPLVLLMKNSPFLVGGVILYVYYLLKPKHSFLIKIKKIFVKEHIVSFVYYISVFYLGYLLVMTLPTKKLDRYMVPVMPYLAIIATLAYYHYKDVILGSSLYKLLVAGLLAFTLVLPLFSYYPYYFTYTSPIFVNAKIANMVIAQKPFGVGIPALKQFILEKYGCHSPTASVYYSSNDDCLTKVPYHPLLGFIDTKPMRVIYGNSNVSDVRVNGSSDYELLVLASDEAIPEKVLDSDSNFVHDSSFYINGLEYWKVYVKKYR